MNIFYLDQNPNIAAEYHCDKHVVKMILETAQILCTIFRKQGHDARYKLTHKNHPSTIWAESSSYNFDWLCELGIALSKEYTNRYGKKHKSQEIIEECINNKHILKFEDDYFIEPPLVMPDDCKLHDTVDSYRLYYKTHKKDFAKWSFTKTPYWYG